MKFVLKIFFLTLICLSACFVGAFPVSAQTASRKYTLDSCYVLARDNYPMMKQYGIIQKLGELSVRDALSSYIPQITLGGEAAYYSDVVAFPEKIEALFSQFAGMDFEGLRNDQYKVLLRTRSGNTGRPIQECSASELQCVGFWVETFTQLDASSVRGVLQQIAVPVSWIEQQTGLTFFPEVPAEVKQQFDSSDWGF